MTDKEKLAEFAEAITSAAPLKGWRWFIDNDWIVLEPHNRFVASSDMAFVATQPSAIDIEAVFRATPSPGVYLRFKLTRMDTNVAQIAAWFEDQAAKERELLDSGRCNNRSLTEERWMVYKASAQSVREGAWRKPT